MAQETKFFYNGTYLEMQNEINAYFAANPTYVIEAMAPMPEQVGYCMLVAYST